MGDVEFAVPTDLPTLTEEETKALQDKPLYTGAGGTDKKDFESSAKEYFDEKNVIPMLNTLLTEVFLKQPEDPIDHMTKFILRHPTLTEIKEHQGQDLHKLSEESVAYSNRYKLPHLIDELLTSLLEDKPDDATRFAGSWLRWHKNGFIARHVPEGYRAYYAAKNEQQK